MTAPAELVELWFALRPEEQEHFQAAKASSRLFALRMACQICAHLPEDAEVRNNASVMGRKAERNVMEQAAADLQVFIKDTSKETARMDGHITSSLQLHQGCIGIECKSNRRVVSSDDLEKFHRDADMNRFAGALLVSERASITGRRSGLDLEIRHTVHGAIWCMYLSPAPHFQSLVTSALHILMQLVQTNGPASLTHLSQNRGLHSIEEEIYQTNSAKKRLRDEMERHGRQLLAVSDSLGAQAQRLHSVATTLQLEPASSDKTKAPNGAPSM